MNSFVDRSYHFEYANHKLTVNFTDGLKLVDPDKPQATIDEFLKDNSIVIFGKEYTYNKDLSTKSVWSFLILFNTDPEVLVVENELVRWSIVSFCVT